MAQQQTSDAVNRLFQAVLPSAMADMSDGQLLGEFVDRRDGVAFATLLRRHGPMVMGVCRRLLQNHHDAEDAFQATFLVLARRAVTICPRNMLANWLFGVARQTARKARTLSLKHRERERQVAELPEPAAPAPNDSPDLRSALDQELSRLPERYRVVIVLCDLEGKTRREAARYLGCPEGSVSSRLSRAREMLAGRLTRQGLMVPAGLVATVLAQESSAAVPISLVSSTVEVGLAVAVGRIVTTAAPAPVMSLTQGVLKTMFLSKIKLASMMVFATAAVVLGGSRIAYQPARASASQPEPVVSEPAAQADDPAPRKGKELENELRRQARVREYELQIARARELLLKEELKVKNDKILDLATKLEVADLEGLLHREGAKQRGEELKRFKIAAEARELLLKELVREKDKEIERLRQENEKLKGRK